MKKQNWIVEIFLQIVRINKKILLEYGNVAVIEISNREKCIMQKISQEYHFSELWIFRYSILLFVIWKLL